MVWITGGVFRMGSDRHYPEEVPTHKVRVNSFFIDSTPVTNRQFPFVAVTSYRTVAGRALDPSAFPALPPEWGQPGSMVFRPSVKPVDLYDVRNWWSWKAGAYWRHPEGRGNSITKRMDHPMVHIAVDDADALVNWSAKALPTEAEWEFPARGGLDGVEYAWSNDLAPGGRSIAHTCQGEFPRQNLRADGFQRTSPVGRYPTHCCGLFDMIGDVLEWTTDWFSASHSLTPTSHTACRRARAVVPPRQASIPFSPTCASRGRWSKMVRTYVRQATAGASAPLLDTRR